MRLIYSVDCFSEEQIPFETPDLSETEVKIKKELVIRQLIEDMVFRGAKNSLFIDEQDIQSILATDEDFKFGFRNAIDYYLVGRWDKCLEL